MFEIDFAFVLGCERVGSCRCEARSEPLSTQL